MARKPYPSDVTDDEWDFVVPYLTLMNEDAPQREHDLREVFNAMRWIVRTGSPWRYMPNDMPPWQVVYQQTQRWLASGVFEAMTHDLRELLRMLAGRHADPSAAIFDSRTLQSTPESGNRAGYDGAKRKKGSKIHLAVDTLGHLLALHVTSANEQDRAQVGKLCKAVQKQTGKSVELAYVDQGYTGEKAENAAAKHKIELSVIKALGARKGLCCCRGGGSWNVVLRGWRDSVAWRRIMSDWRQR